MNTFSPPLEAFFEKERSLPDAATEDELEPELYIRRYVFEYSIALYDYLRKELYKHFTKLDDEYPWRVLILSFKRHLGSQELFWDPLFADLSRMLRVASPDLTDDEVWDKIIPSGSKALLEIKERLPFSQEGPFDFPIPKLL